MYIFIKKELYLIINKCIIMNQTKTKSELGNLRGSKDLTATASEFKKIKYLPSRKNIDTNTYAIHY